MPPLHRILVVSLLTLVLGSASASASTFEYLGSFGSPGNTDGQFDTPVGVAVTDAGTIVVSDAARNRITQWTYGGALIGGFGSAGAGNGQFNTPRGMANTPTGLVVVDSGNNRIQKFSAGGAYITQYGAFGTGNGQFSAPVDIAVDPGWVYVTDAGNGRIQKFSPTGVYVRQWPVTSVQHLGANQGTVIAGGGQALSAFSVFGDIGPTFSNDLNYVGGVAFDPRRSGFWAYEESGASGPRLRRYSDQLALQDDVALSGAATVISQTTGTPGAGAITVDCRGTLLLADRVGARVLRFGDPAAPPPPCGAPASATSAAAVAFAAQRVSTVGAPSRVNLQATGNGIDVSRVRVTGPDADSFLVSRDDCTDRTAWPGAPCGVSLRFAPDHAGNLSATLEIRDATTQTTRSVALTGDATPEPQVGPGPAGPAGATGPAGAPGPTGATGPAGAAAKVSCAARLVKTGKKKKLTAKVTCTVKRAVARLTLLHGGVTVARGSGRGTVRLTVPRPLRGGRYILRVVDGSGHAQYLTLRLPRR